MPRGFKISVEGGWEVYVLGNRQWQYVEVSIYNRGRPRFGEGRGVIYTVSAGLGKNDDTVERGRAYVSERTIIADLGPLGSIEMQFVPSGGRRRYRPYCGGKTTAFKQGRYQGILHLAAGHDYPPVEETVGKPDPGLQLAHRCLGPTVAVGPSTLGGAQLIANSIRSRVPSFEAFKASQDGPAYIEANVHEYHHGVSVTRFARVVAPSNACDFSRSLEFASAEPPAPFSGTGVYRRHRPRAQRWSGGLSVDLPGRDDVALTHSPIRGFINPARWVPPRPKRAR